MSVAYRLNILPWTPIEEDERRFRRLLVGMALVALLLGVLMPWLPLPEVEEGQVPELPSRYAEFLLEKPALPPPTPVVRESHPDPVEAVERTPERTHTANPEPAPETRPDARERASKAGVMAFADSLADLRDHASVESVTRQDGLSSGVGETRHSERSLITSKAGRGSGGINTAGLSRNTGGAGVGGRQTTSVTSRIGRGAADGAGGTGEGEGTLAARSREEIELVFDRNKSAIFALYNRALRKDPALRGKLVLELTIAPNGVVTDCQVVSSELGHGEFERKLVARVKLFRFEARDVATVTTTKPIDFFPA